MDETPEKTEVTLNENTIQPETQVTESVEDVNWRKFREQREKERREKEEAEARARKSQEEAAALKAAMDSLLNKPSRSHIEDDPDFEDEEVKLQKKIDAALAARDKIYQEQRRREEQEMFPTRLKQSLPDFDTVCTEENLDYLEYHHPNIAKSFSQMPDGYEKWAGVYDLVKKLVPNTSSQKDQKKAEKNLTKPQSMARAGMGGTNDQAPHMIDEAKKRANWERMQRVMKGL